MTEKLTKSKKSMTIFFMLRTYEIVLILKPCVQSFIFLIYEKQRSKTTDNQIHIITQGKNQCDTSEELIDVM